MELEEIKEKFRNMFKERLSLSSSTLGVTDDSLLFSEDGWGIDSVDVIDIVLGIEEIFGVTLKQDDEVKKHFETLNTLAQYVSSLIRASV